MNPLQKLFNAPSGARMRSALAGTALALIGSAAAAQAYPSKPIRLVVPFPPGGAVDVYARHVQPALQDALGQPVVVENKAGAGGMLGADAVAKAPPDGYTLLVGNIATLAMNAAIYKKMPYDPAKDFTPIMKTVMVNYVVVVHPGVPAGKLTELVAYAKANPGKLSYGSSGAGSAQHMAAELFKAQAGIEMTHVPYKGTGALVGDLVGGHINVAFADEASMLPQVRSGKLRALAVGGLVRSPELPDLPTVAEAAGLPRFEAAAWQGIAGPAALPPAIVRRVHEALESAHAAPGMKAKLAAAGLGVAGSTPEEFGQFIRSEIAKWTLVAKTNGITAD